MSCLSITTLNQNRWSQVWTRVLLSTEHSCCVTMKITMASKEQPTLWTPPHPGFTPSLSRTQTAYELKPRMARTYSQPAERRTYSSVCRPSPRLCVCLIDPPTTIALPEIAVRDYLFGEPRLFFKWPYLSLKKMRHLGTTGVGMFCCFF